MAEKSRRGFAAMDREKQRQIASKGGKAAHEKGSAHEFTPDQAREAGRKGGRAAHARGTAHKFTSREAQEAGRKGGLNSHRATSARRSGEGPESNAAPAEANNASNLQPQEMESRGLPQNAEQNEARQEPQTNELAPRNFENAASGDEVQGGAPLP